MIYVAALVILINLFVSLYCFIRKRKGPPNTANNGNNATYSSVMMKSVSFANDVTFLLFKITGYIPSHIIRKLFYRYVFHITMGKNVVIYYGFEARSPWNIFIGDNCIIGDHAIFDARYGIRIGNNVNFSNGVWIWTLQHDLNSVTFGTENQGAAVIIKDRAWISSRTSILPGCLIEEGVVIACGAVVTHKETLPFGVYGGVPAKIISMRNKKINYTLESGHRHFI